MEELQERYPRLIPCIVSGYPPEGPSRDKKAYDALIQAETGLMSITGGPGAPAKTGISTVDIAAGSYAYSGILAALRHRDRTGEALPVRVSLFEAMTEWMGYPLYYAMHSGISPVPMGTSHPTIAPYGAITTAGDHQVMIAVQNEREWANLCTHVLQRPDLLDDNRFQSNSLRVANREALDAELARAFAELDLPVVLERLDRAQIAWSNLNTLTSMANHPELAAESRWLDTAVPGATVRTLRPVATPGGRCAEAGTVPAFGEHTTAVLAELQLTEETMS